MDADRPPGQPASPFRLRLAEIAALVVGYGLAAVLFRVFWPRTGLKLWAGILAVGFYAWLGLAMSGPLLLARRPSRGPESSTDEGGRGHLLAPSSRTWAELAWLLIGAYWIVMGVFILPARLHRFALGDTLLFGLVPVLAGVGLRAFGPRRDDRRKAHPPWTHHAGVALLWTWPVAWICLVAVGTTLF